MPTIRKIPPPEAAPAARPQADPRPPLADVVAAQDTGAPLPININLIDDNPYQPRLVYDDERIAAIAASIRQHGLLQAPLGRRIPDGRVQLAFGHSRLRAFRKLAAVIPSDVERFGRMPVLLRDLDEETMALHAWIENRDRKDLTAYEEAKAIERYTTAFGWTQKQAADKLQLTQPTIANKLRLLKLPATALHQLEQGAISERQAAALLPLAELTESARETNVNHWIGTGYIVSVNDLMAQAAKHDSATLRRLSDTMLDRLTIPLAKQPWRNEVWDLADVQAPRCADCPIRLKSSDRCPDKLCAERKSGAQKAALATAAAAAANLPTTTHTNYGTFDDLSGVNLKAIRAKAAEKGCGNLAVQYSEGRYYAHKIDGHPNCGIVCGHGPNKRCGCKQSLARSADPTSSTEAKNRHEKQHIKQELIGPAEEAARFALAHPTPAVWRKLLARVDSRAKVAPDADIPAIQAAIAAALVSNEVHYYLEFSPNFATARSTLTRLLRELGVEAPWTEQPASNDLRANATSPLDPLRRALQSIANWLDEDEDDTEPEAIQSALAELAEARRQLEQLSDAPEDVVSGDDYAAVSAQISDLERRVRTLAELESEVGA